MKQNNNASLIMLNFLFAVAHEMWLLYVSRLIGGIGAAAMIPSMLAYVADITSAMSRDLLRA